MESESAGECFPGIMRLCWLRAACQIRSGSSILVFGGYGFEHELIYSWSLISFGFPSPHLFSFRLPGGPGQHRKWGGSHHSKGTDEKTKPKEGAQLFIRAYKTTYSRSRVAERAVRFNAPPLGYPFEQTLSVTTQHTISFWCWRFHIPSFFDESNDLNMPPLKLSPTVFGLLPLLVFFLQYANAASTPAPLVVEPSRLWDGGDGPWSTWNLTIGTPPQKMRVTINTSGSGTWYTSAPYPTISLD